MLEAATLLTVLALSPPILEPEREAPVDPTYGLSAEEMLEIDMASIVVLSPIPFLNVFYVDADAWEHRHELRRAERKERRAERKERRARRKRMRHSTVSS